MQTKEFLNDLIGISESAGLEIMKIYEKDFSVYEKEDKSPLTEADEISHAIIAKHLSKNYPAYPVLSEESPTEDWQSRKEWDSYFLVDPLDGTKEFIKKNGEFTVNIAFISKNKPVAGVVYLPAQNVFYWAHKELGSFKQTVDNEYSLNCSSIPIDMDNLKIIGSRSHQSELMKDFADNFPGHEIVAAGSSLKFCLLAEGKADVYPRFGPTSEWDTAAGQCVLEYAGGSVYDNYGKPLGYNEKDSVLNPYFIGMREYDETVLDNFKVLSTKS